MNRDGLITIEGFLGKDRELRETPDRTCLGSRWNEVAEMNEPYEFTVRGREFIRLSLAEKVVTPRGTETRWHSLVAWDLHRQSVAGIRLARKGDRVRITGRREKYGFTTPNGEYRENVQVVIESFQFLKHKIRHEAP